MTAALHSRITPPRSAAPRSAAPRLACTAAAGLALLAIAAPASAGGFQINETSASGLGTAYAGGAAAADNASTLWSNVAGIARLRRPEIVGALNLVKPSIKFGNTASEAAAGQALGGNGGDAGGVNAVPNLYIALPLGERWTVGLGVNAPFGLVTAYDGDWLGRFQAQKSSIRTVNANPGVAWRPASNVSLGVGLDVQHITAEFTNQVNYSAALLSAAAQNGIAPGSAAFNAIAQATPRLETHARIQGSDTAFGWNAGVLWEIDPQTRVGAHYRSGIGYRLRGDATFANPVPVAPAPLAGTVAALAAGVNARALFDSGVTADVRLPAIANVSFFKTLAPRWDVMADAQWTQWSSIRALTFVRSDGSVLQSTPENFRDTWKLSVGAHHRVASDLLLRAGLAFDQSPVRAADRTPRLPDADRVWFTGGLQYAASPRLKLDLGAAYIRVKNAPIDIAGNPPSSAAYGRIDGRYASNTVIVSAQAGYAF